MLQKTNNSNPRVSERRPYGTIYINAMRKIASTISDLLILITEQSFDSGNEI